MIDLYALTSPNVQKIFIMLEEVALPYNTILVDVWKTRLLSECRHRAAWFRALVSYSFWHLQPAPIVNPPLQVPDTKSEHRMTWLIHPANYTWIVLFGADRGAQLDARRSWVARVSAVLIGFLGGSPRVLRAWPLMAWPSPSGP